MQRELKTAVLPRLCRGLGLELEGWLTCRSHDRQLLQLITSHQILEKARRLVRKSRPGPQSPVRCVVSKETQQGVTQKSHNFSHTSDHVRAGDHARQETAGRAGAKPGLMMKRAKTSSTGSPVVFFFWGFHPFVRSSSFFTSFLDRSGLSRIRFRVQHALIISGRRVAQAAASRCALA